MSRITVLLTISAAFVSDSCKSTSSAQYVSQANALNAKGRYEEASLVFRKAIQKETANAPAWYGLGLAEYRQNHYPVAHAALRNAVRLAPRDAAAVELLGDLCLASYLADSAHPQRLYAELRTTAGELHALPGDHFAEYRLNGYLAVIDRNAPLAVQNFQKAHSLRPDQPEIAERLVEALFSNGNTEEGDELARTFLRSHPQSDSLYVTWYGNLMRAGRTKDAEAVLSGWRAAKPKSLAPSLALAQHFAGLGRSEDTAKTLEELAIHEKEVPGSLLAAGDFEMNRQDWKSAIRLFERGAQAHPGDSVYNKRVVACLMASGEWTQAAQFLDDIVKSDPADADALAARGSLRIAKGGADNVEAAIRDLRSLCTRFPESPTFHNGLGRAYAARFDYTHAEAEFEEALKRDPHHLPSLLALGQIQLRRHRFPKAIQRADEALALHPQESSASLIRSAALAGLGRVDEARAVVTSVLTQSPHLRAARLQLALLDSTEHRFLEAENIYRAEYDPKARDFRALRGWVEMLRERGDAEAGFELAKREAASNPNELQLTILAGDAAVAASKVSTAAEYYRQALTQSGGASPEALSRLGEATLALGRNAEAVALLRKAVEQDPADAMPAMLLATACERSGQSGDAIAAYRMALARDPGNPLALNNLASLLLAGGANLNEALQMATEAVKRSPQVPEYADTLGMVRLKMQKVEDARVVFAGLVRQYPANRDFRFHYGLTLLARGDRSTARTELNAAIAPGSPDRNAEIQKVLATIPQAP